MKWLLLLTLLILPIFLLPSSAFYRFRGGGDFSYYKYSQTIVIQPSSTQIVRETQNGSALSTAPWLNPSYVSVYDKYYLQVLPNAEYEDNNVSLSLSTVELKSFCKNSDRIISF
ncbi:hypothetical protein [Sulfurisphaera ohwakuensis]|uniref:Uncharacterized protein n=1 Tax=Sulfurisphaera ohwakuensis TaxID=69656 RepID=A0A650CDH5_SULOH|nr:hypothetical protein [Sulfurisphaera ohwakuensis]MBB5253210.1 hypothetical protein [Sulfurisphaera ohwakuensis]QGR15881.1 hypothetical protein D1869_00745 [Sulfurisphaera ohwakuensis]